MNVSIRFFLAAALMTASCGAWAQRTTQSPATDSAAQASPVAAAPKTPIVDGSSESSPEAGLAPHHGASIAAGTTLRVALSQAIDSGRLKNGQAVSAKLQSPVRTTAGTTLAAGTPVVVSVVETVPAGKLTAMGEFSLQAVRVGSVEVTTEIKTYRGKEGKRDVADAVPAVGTDAGLAAGAALTFRVQPANPGPVSKAPAQTATTPGSVDGTASGGAPPKDTSNSGEPTFGTAPTASTAPTNNTFAPAASATQGQSTQKR